MRIWDYPARERGGDDYDQPYRFGRVPSSQWPAPFTLHQLVRLTLLKMRIRAEQESAPPAEAPTNVAVGGD